ncbi:hypothetical protein T08_822 [Trichinella sp. T8]|nr:hypothetical protein T08_822 [Trichinella sp. T8]
MDSVITHAAVRLNVHIHKDPQQSSSELAKQMGYSPYTISRPIHFLEKFQVITSQKGSEQQVAIYKQRLTGFTISFAFFDEQDVKMFLAQLFNCEFVNRFRYVIRMATAIHCIAMVVAILYLFVQYRKAKNTVWRRRRAIRHHQVLKDIGCFKWVPLRLYSKVPNKEYLRGRNGQQMAFKKIVAMRRDPPLNRIMKQMKPVKMSRENRVQPPKDVILLTIYL